MPCNPELYQELKRLIEVNRVGNDQTIFQNEKGKAVCHDNFADRRFMSDMKTWGGRRIRFHDLRHTATTLMIANGIDLKTVKEICGHANIATTMNYVHLVAGSIERVAKSFSVKPQAEERENVEVKKKNLSLVQNG